MRVDLTEKHIIAISGYYFSAGAYDPQAVALGPSRCIIAAARSKSLFPSSQHPLIRCAVIHPNHMETLLRPVWEINSLLAASWSTESTESDSAAIVPQLTIPPTMSANLVALFSNATNFSSRRKVLQKDTDFSAMGTSILTPRMMMAAKPIGNVFKISYVKASSTPFVLVDNEFPILDIDITSGLAQRPISAKKITYLDL